MSNVALHSSLQQDFDVTIPEKATLQDLHNILSAYIDELIQKDFERLIFLLYKIDVSEKKLKQILKEQAGKNAGKIIAELVIERQQQKIIARTSKNY